VQLDQTAFPILLAHRLKAAGALKDFDPYPLVLRAGAYLVHHGPVTEQERWEEAGGYSPATLAVVVAALMCAPASPRTKATVPTADFLRDYADWLERHIEDWTVTSRGTLHPDIARHYVRITPARPGETPPTDGPDDGRTVGIANRAPNELRDFPASGVIDAGFLELVRWGLRPPDDPLIRASLDVADRVLRRDTPRGAAWRRYNHDGYGQRANGDPYADGWGQGRAWPLLAGERAHYELAAGNTDFARTLRDALESFAAPAGLLPEQVWDAPDDLPERYLWRGAPTGAARPLAWAHAEYISLLRSLHEGRVIDCLPEVAARYAAQRSRRATARGSRGSGAAPRPRRELWSHIHPTPTVPAGSVLRVLAPRPFRLHWTRDDWETYQDTPALAVPALGVHHIDLPIPLTPPREPIRFTFFWTDHDQWDGRDQSVGVV
jgi:glucoamylase